jgi:starch synthase
MKGALVTSDYITTVSQRYAEELKYDFFAFGLEEVIAGVSHKMTGIINGIDYGYFSPDKGGEIDFPYTKRGVKGGKAKNKKALLNEVGMSADPDTPLAVMITRLATQKGIELFLHIAEELLLENINVIVLGTGEKEYEFALKQLEEKFSNFKALLTFNRVLSKRLYASADMFLMPSKFEPCGLSQMISCSYGTIPVVRAVGGLYDSIIPYPSLNSNGFRFDNYNAHELLFATKYAIEVYNNKAEWEALRKRAMSSDFTWLTSAERYVTLYNNLLY